MSMTTFLFYSNYDKLHLLYVGGSHVSTLECLYDCLLDNMFLFFRNKLILILYVYHYFIFFVLENTTTFVIRLNLQRRLEYCEVLQLSRLTVDCFAALLFCFAEFCMCSFCWFTSIISSMFYSYFHWIICNCVDYNPILCVTITEMLYSDYFMIFMYRNH